MKARGKWSLWQGFNYGGRYTAKMDLYCDLVATCLASPNGLAEYRLANLDRMFDRFAVDGVYVDDNLAYPTCTLWKEHGHPQPIYDTLIELHEMNWRRREMMRRRCPHMVLVSHCASGFVLPVICDFDAQIYGEGYSFGTVENYWNNFVVPVRSLHAQGMIWPGDSESVRCAAAIAYNYDLLTGGGQYTQIDWRLFPQKFSHAAGVTDLEPFYAEAYNLAQQYFGRYESRAFCFADSRDLFSTSTRLTYATVYQNRVWGDWLIPIANMDAKEQQTSVVFRSPHVLGILPERDYLLFDLHQRKTRSFTGDALNQALRDISIPGQNLRLFYLLPLSKAADGPFHVWGGKRISERWDARRQKLVFEVQGPPGWRDEVFIAAAKHNIQEVMVAGRREDFSIDPAQDLAHGQVTFAVRPVKIEVLCARDQANGLSERPVSAGLLIQRGALNLPARR